MPAGLLVIGIDAADWTLVRRWSDAGLLPAIAALRACGTTVEIEGEAGFGDDPAWASLYTGVGPARHGRFFYHQLWPGGNRPRLFRDDDLAYPPFWLSLDRAGRRVAVLDVPKCPLTTGFNGIQLVDWQVHGRDHSKPHGWPSRFAADVVARFGAFDEHFCRLPALGHAHLPRFVDSLLASLSAKEALVGELLAREPWDLIFAVFQEPHCIGHLAWHIHDAGHPEHDVSLARTLGDPLLCVYRAVDAAIGRLAAAAGPESTIMVFSGIGMAANYTGHRLIEPLLARWHLLARQSGAAARPHCIAVPHNEIAGAIRLYLAGRERHGWIQPGAEADAVLASLVSYFLGWRVHGTGEPLVAEAIRVDDRHAGPRRDLLPDLLLVWNRRAPIDVIDSELWGELRSTPGTQRPGNHRRGGFALARGPGVATGAVAPAMRLIDLAPTVALHLGAALPDCDGVPLTAVLPAGRTVLTF